MKRRVSCNLIDRIYEITTPKALRKRLPGRGAASSAPTEIRSRGAAVRHTSPTANAAVVMYSFCIENVNNVMEEN
ncbi:MAG: hypothetical protein ACRD10_04600 [Terriglobia bacterium]